jgi:hypothetical protein
LFHKAEAYIYGDGDAAGGAELVLESDSSRIRFLGIPIQLEYLTASTPPRQLDGANPISREVQS